MGAPNIHDPVFLLNVEHAAGRDFSAELPAAQVVAPALICLEARTSEIVGKALDAEIGFSGRTELVACVDVHADAVAMVPRSTFALALQG